MEKINNNNDKQTRIESLQPVIKIGKIKFSKRHRTLLEQLKYYPKGRHDDAVDALEMLYRVCLKHKRPGLTITVM